MKADEMVRQRRSKPFMERFLKELANPAEAAAYLRAALADSEESFQTAVNDVARAVIEECARESDGLGCTCMEIIDGRECYPWCALEICKRVRALASRYEDTK